jgi:hypothetical protein
MCEQLARDARELLALSAVSAQRSLRSPQTKGCPRSLSGTRERVPVARRRCRVGRFAGAQPDSAAFRRKQHLRRLVLRARLLRFRGLGGVTLGPVWVREPPWFPDECRALRLVAAGANNSFFAGSFDAEREPRVLLAMQKVEGSNPFSRFQKAGISRPFCVRSRLVHLRRVGLTPDSPRADRRPSQEKRSVCSLIRVRPNRSPSVGLQKVECSACCGGYPDS